MLNSPKTPLKVALLSISPHNRAILEFFFAGAGKNLFRTVEVHDAEAFIVDFDHPGGEQEWQKQQTQSIKPAIVLSVRETAGDSIIWVAKPLTSQALAQAAADIQQLLTNSASPPLQQTVSASLPANKGIQGQENHGDISALRALLDSHKEHTQSFGITNPTGRTQQQSYNPPKAPPPTPSHRYAPTTKSNSAAHDATDHEHILGNEDVFIPLPIEDKQLPKVRPDRQTFEDSLVVSAEEERWLEQRWQQLCGNHDERIDITNWQQSPQLYTPENYLLNSLIDALKLAQQSGQYVQLQADESVFILLMPDVSLAYCSLDIQSSEFTQLCNTPLRAGNVNLHLPSTGELVMLQETIQHDAQKTYDMEALIWTVSLLTSHGRLSHNARPDQSLRLKYWPNLTRLEQFPHVMRIAAIWHQNAGTLFGIAAQAEDIPQRYLIAFFNASHTLGMFTVQQASAAVPQEKAAPKKNRGLFSRLLKRLLGGGK